jgi:hypothetical protein
MRVEDCRGETREVTESVGRGDKAEKEADLPPEPWFHSIRHINKKRRRQQETWMEEGKEER